MQTCIRSFNQAIEKAHLWLKDLTYIGNFNSEEEAYTALRSILHTLRDRLPINESAHFASQLPMLIRGVYYDGWRPSSVPEKFRTKNEFIEYVKSNLVNANDAINISEAIQAVFSLLNKYISQGEMNHIKSTMPHDLLHLWPEKSSQG